MEISTVSSLSEIENVLKFPLFVSFWSCSYLNPSSRFYSSINISNAFYTDEQNFSNYDPILYEISELFNQDNVNVSNINLQLVDGKNISSHPTNINDDDGVMVEYEGDFRGYGVIIDHSSSSTTLLNESLIILSSQTSSYNQQTNSFYSFNINSSSSSSNNNQITRDRLSNYEINSNQQLEDEIYNQLIPLNESILILDQMRMRNVSNWIEIDKYDSSKLLISSLSPFSNSNEEEEEDGDHLIGSIFTIDIQEYLKPKFDYLFMRSSTFQSLFSNHYLDLTIISSSGMIIYTTIPSDEEDLMLKDISLSYNSIENYDLRISLKLIESKFGKWFGFENCEELKDQISTAHQNRKDIGDACVHFSSFNEFSSSTITGFSVPSPTFTDVGFSYSFVLSGYIEISLILIISYFTLYLFCIF